MGERVKRSDVGPTIKRNTGVHRRTWRKPTANRSPHSSSSKPPRGCLVRPERVLLQAGVHLRLSWYLATRGCTCLSHMSSQGPMSVEGKLRALQEPGWRFQLFIFLWPRLSQVPPLQERFCSPGSRPPPLASAAANHPGDVNEARREARWVSG